MVVTRRAVFRGGYKRMDPATIPQLKDGYKEKGARFQSCFHSLALILCPRPDYVRLDSQG